MPQPKFNPANPDDATELGETILHLNWISKSLTDFEDFLLKTAQPGDHDKLLENLRDARAGVDKALAHLHDTVNLPHPVPSSRKLICGLRQRERRHQQRAASVAAYISQCDEALRAGLTRSNGQWPDSLTLPLWPGEIERLALVQWMDELTNRSGKRIRFDFEPPISAPETTSPITWLN